MDNLPTWKSQSKSNGMEDEHMRKAFLVGINEYAQSPLKGCVNDVRLMEKHLRGFGFDVETCLDGQATKANILAGLGRLLKDGGDGDVAFFHFSGHGSQIADAHGDEADGYDEIICPFDIFSGQYITDDDLHTVFSTAHAGVTVEVFLDCCHSGTGIRGDINLGPDGVPLKEVTGRFLNLSNVLVRHLPVARKLADKLQAHNTILWSACRDYETAADALIEQDNNGAFTANFVKVWQADTDQSRTEILERLSRNMRKYGFVQVPQLECDRTQGDSQFASTLRKLTVKKKLGNGIRHFLEKIGA